MARLLVLGGTGFVGGAVVAAARAANHDVTILTRGRSGSAPAGVRALTADRDDEEALAGALGGLPSTRWWTSAA